MWKQCTKKKKYFTAAVGIECKTKYFRKSKITMLTHDKGHAKKT